MATAATQLRDWKSKVDMKDPASTALATGEFVAPLMDDASAGELNVLHLLHVSTLGNLTAHDDAIIDNSYPAVDLGHEESQVMSHLTGSDRLSPSTSCSTEPQHEEKSVQSVSDARPDESTQSLKGNQDLESLIKYVQLHAFDSQLKRLRTLQANDGAIFPTTNTIAEGISQLIRLGVLSGGDMASKQPNGVISTQARISEVDLASDLLAEKARCAKLEEELRIERRIREGLMQELCRFFTSRQGMDFVDSSRQSSTSTQSHGSDEEIMTLLRLQKSHQRNSSNSPRSSESTSPLSSGRSSLDSPYRSASTESITPRPSLSSDKKSFDALNDQTINHATHDIKLYQMLAEQGYSEAQYKLGYLHEHGMDVIQDRHLALVLYRKASTQGHVKAQYILGVWSEQGTHVPKNEHDAFKYYKLAADQSYVPAQYSLGQCYYRGLGTLQDINEAVRFFYLANEKSYAPAQHMLAICYKKGTGIERNAKKAAKLFRLASDQGCIKATYHLGKCYEFGMGVTQDIKQAIALYQRASDLNYSEAHRKLGKCYEKGHGLHHDESKAFYYFKKASLQGNPRAQCDVGYCYQHGIGVPRDEKEAYKMYRMAAEQGYEQAKGFLLRHSYENKEKAEELYNIVKNTQHRQKTPNLQFGKPSVPFVAKHTYKIDNSSEGHMYGDMNDLQLQSSQSVAGLLKTNDLPIGKSSIIFDSTADISERSLMNTALSNSANNSSTKSCQSLHKNTSKDHLDTSGVADNTNIYLRKQELKYREDQLKNSTLPHSKEMAHNKPADFSDLAEWL